MKRFAILMILVGASAVWLTYGAVNSLLIAQHKQVSALSIADQNN